LWIGRVEREREREIDRKERCGDYVVADKTWSDV
jgi:hypothetical protein